MFREPFAAGHVFSMSMLDTLLYQVISQFDLNHYIHKTVLDERPCLTSTTNT